MAKNDVNSVKRPPFATRAFPFHCSLSEQSYPVTLRRLTSMELIDSFAQGNEYYQQYVTGSGPRIKEGANAGKLNTDSPKYVAPQTLLAPDGIPIRLSYSSCRMLAQVEMAQIGAADDLYTFAELAVLTCSTDIAMEITEAAGWIQPDFEAEDDDQGNSQNTSGEA